MIARLNHNYFSSKCHCKAAWPSCTEFCQCGGDFEDIIGRMLLCIPHCFTYLIIIKFVGILIFLNRVMYTRGYPSEFISYTLENICVKFHAFIRSVTKISLRDWTTLGHRQIGKSLK